MSIIDLHRDTLLESSIQTYDALKSQLTSRIVLTSTIHASSSAGEWVEYLKDYIESVKKREKNVAGMLMIVNKSIVLLLECNIKIINSILGELREKLNEYNKNIVKYNNILSKEKEINKDLKDIPIRSSLVFGSMIGKSTNVPTSSSHPNVNQSANFSSPNTASLSVNVNQSNNLSTNASGNNSNGPSVNSSHIGSITTNTSNNNLSITVANTAANATTNPNLPTLISPLLNNIRILSFSEEVQRFCKYFSIRQLQNVPKPDNEDFKKTDPIILVSELLRTVLEVGRVLSSAEDAAAAQLMFSTGNLPTNPNTSTKEGKGQPSIITKLPSSEQFIAHLCGIETMMTSEEYLDIYTQPVHVVLESERVWPVEPYLKY